jgi:hypothetical protein
MNIEKNSQGYFRVRLSSGVYMRDTDIMSMVTGSHVSKIMTYGSRAAALSAYAHYLELRSRTGYAFSYVDVVEDFKEID